MGNIKQKCEQCKMLGCSFLYNNEYCLLNEEYLEDIQISDCGIVFNKYYNRDVFQDEEETYEE